MAGRAKITPEETVELQRLYSELPAAIAEAGDAVRSEQGDEKVDTIIKRICQLTDESEAM
jgi:hypothetical protein